VARRPNVVTDSRQQSFDFVTPRKYEVELVGETPHGYGLFRKPAGHGGYVYYTDQYGVGVEVLDTGITDLISVFAALVHDNPEQAKLMWQHLGVVFDFEK